MKRGQFPAVIQLADLNGQNGFKIDGENAGDYSGFPVHAAGDVNFDGYSDLIIGANRIGDSYIVFGSPEIGQSGSLLLSDLNGINGFKIEGEVINGTNAISVSEAGDINGDGNPDLLIGADFQANTTGRSYVLFGHPQLGQGGLFLLSSVNGSNGFKLEGEAVGDYSGISVSGGVDINQDGYTDLLIGAYKHNVTGRSYVVFGDSVVGQEGLLLLSGLNGTNGFKLDSEVGSSASGNSVSMLGDINNDGYSDFVIGAFGHLNRTGRSYVVFGGPIVGQGGLLPLSSLNGTNGFKLEGEMAESWSGWCVTSAGDVNGDSVDDVLIGALHYGNQAGRSYVVFGGSEVGQGGLLQLSSLNGVNGFKLDGEAVNDMSGRSMGVPGDINGDGYTDLIIGSSRHANQTGRSYVIFGGPRVGQGGLLSLADLNGVNGFMLDGENTDDLSGHSVSSVRDINGDSIDDLVIGAPQRANQTGRSYVVFGDAPPVLVNNRLSLSVGAAITLNSTFISAYDRNHNNNTLVFVPGAVEHGQFEAVGAPGIALSNFTQQQVTAGAIQFVHDGTLVAPSYNITVRSDGIAWTGPVSAKVDFSGAPLSYFSTIFPLASLNGQNGFKLNGEKNYSYSGSSFSTPSDINGDGHIDLIIGASGGGKKGRTYVIFGGFGVGNEGLFNLSSLNGTNGFTVDAEKYNDQIRVGDAGDLNNDGYDDVVIGAPYYPGGGGPSGRSYVIFGGPEIGGNGTFNLSSLSGFNGFKLEGENPDDQSGRSISAVGDINGDGHHDLIIGANSHLYGSDKGRSYVIFGGPGMGASGAFNLSNLNGSNGFKLDGENTNDYSGWSLSVTGDMNDDGHTDFIIGAVRYPGGSYKGRSYLVYGGPNVGIGGALNLSSLNGMNGFKLDGENNLDFSGSPVKAAGDINGDGHADLVIGADTYPANGGIGRSYVVFGGAEIYSGDVFNLSSLNGANGFKLDGEGGDSGSSVSAAGDINGDGFDDLVIGAPNYRGGFNTSWGRSYVVFGGPGVGSSGILKLSTLNGINGFKLDGENIGDQSGKSVSAAGDINGDGYADLVIGAPYYQGGGGIGRSYVIFGDAPPTLVHNRLWINQSQTAQVNATFLSAYDRNHNNNSLIFFPSNVTHGYFERIDQPGMPLVNFTQPQLLNDTIQFVHDGSAFAPSYNITVRGDGIAWTGPHAANITFIPAMTTTTTSIPTTTIVTTPTPSPTTTPNPTPSTSTLTTTSTPSFTPTPSTTTIAPTPAPTSTPTVTPRAPIVLINNQLPISNGTQVILSPSHLQATEAGYDSSQLVFLLGEVQNGYFTLTAQNTTRLTSFTQGQIDSGEVTFVHSGDGQAPGYQVMVTDGEQYTAPDSPVIYFTDAPIITENTLTLEPGEAVTLTPSNLNVTITDGSAPGQVICRVEDLQHAAITQLPSELPVSNFTLADLQSGKIQVTQDSSNYAAVSYVISCGGRKGIQSVPSTVDTHFSYQGIRAPQLSKNNLFISQGGSVTLTTTHIYATQNGSDPLSQDAFFYISEVSHGHFSLSGFPGTVIAFFSQDQLQNGQVMFTQDNSIVPPGYRLSVRALGLESARLPAKVILRLVNQPPKQLHSLTDQTATVGKPFTYAIPAGSFVDPEGEALTFTISGYNSNTSLPDWLEFDGLSNRLIGTPTEKDFIRVNVTAQDPQGLSATTDVTINVSEPTPASGLSSWQRTIIGALISGGIGIGFVVAQICLKRIANKKLLQVLGEGEDKYDQEVVRPVAKEIAQRLKITRFMNAITNKELMAFKSAVRSLLSALERREVDLNFSKMKESKRDEVINEVGNQTYRWMKANQKGCAKSCPGLHSFFKPQLRPEVLQEAAEDIAEQVVLALQKRPQSQPRLSAGLSVASSPVYKELEDKRSLELSEIDSPSKKGVELEEQDLAAAQLN